MNRFIVSDYFSLIHGVKQKMNKKKRQFEQAPSIYLMDEATSGKYLDKLGGLTGKSPSASNKYGKVHAVRLKEQIINQLVSSDILENSRLKTLTERSVQSACFVIDEAIQTTLKLANKVTEEYLRGNVYEKLLDDNGGIFDVDSKVTFAGKKEYWRFKSVFKNSQISHRLFYGRFTESFVNQSKLYRLSMIACNSNCWTVSEGVPAMAKIETDFRVAVTTQKSAFYIDNHSIDAKDLTLNVAYASSSLNKTKLSVGETYQRLIKHKRIA